MNSTLEVVLAIFSIASTLGAASAIFYGVRNRTIITTLKESNDAYKERNGQLEDQIKELRAEVLALTSKVDTLLKLKTPDISALTTLMSVNHKEVMLTLQGKADQP